MEHWRVINMNFRELKRKRVYLTKRWREIRKVVLKRDKFTCQNCGIILTRNQHIDHIIDITYENIDDEKITFDVDNLQTLCSACHAKKTKRKTYKTCVFNGKDVDYTERSRL
jgi:5-methylcytosine-specific restriction protein A